MNPAGLDDLRGILVGGVPAAYEQQLARLEAVLADQRDRLRRDLRALEERIEKRIAETNASVSAATGELRQQLLVESRALEDAVAASHAEAIERVKDVIDRMQNAKLDHGEYASFLGSLSRQLHQNAARDAAEDSR